MPQGFSFIALGKTRERRGVPGGCGLVTFESNKTLAVTPDRNSVTHSAVQRVL